MKFIRAFVRIFYLPIIVYLANLFLWQGLDIYENIPWVDTPMHAFGGLVIGIANCRLLDYWTERGLLGKTKSAIRALFAFALVATTAALWEFHEFLLDRYFFTLTQLSIPDTMKDMALGMLGGAAAILIRVGLKAKQRR